MPSSNCICSCQEKNKTKPQSHMLEIHHLKQRYKKLGKKKGETNEGRKPMENSYTDNNHALAT